VAAQPVAIVAAGAGLPIVSVRPDTNDFRSFPINGHSQGQAACLKRANFCREQVQQVAAYSIRLVSGRQKATFVCAHIHGIDVPVEEPFTASNADMIVAPLFRLPSGDWDHLGILGKPVVNLDPFDFFGDPAVLAWYEGISIVEKCHSDTRRCSVPAPRADSRTTPLTEHAVNAF
jgi:hypothetical protein